MEKQLSLRILMILLLAGIMLQFGCSNAEQKNTAAPPVKSESSVAAFIYDKADLNAEWDESDAMLKKLEMPFFRTADNLRVSLPGC